MKMTLARLVGDWNGIWYFIFNGILTDSVVVLFAAAASLFPEFLDVFHKNSSSAVFDLLEDYQTLCQDKVGGTLCMNKKKK